MELVIFILCGVLLIVILLLTAKIVILQKSIKEIGEEITDFLSTDTNIKITTDSRDKYLKKLLITLNEQLAILQNERHLYYRGDMELKNAIANISHDLRTPLTAISGYIELLKQASLQNSEKISKNEIRYLEIIKNRIQVMKQLTEELFTYSFLVSVKENFKLEDNLQTVMINGIIEESVASYYTAFKEAGITPEILLPNIKIERKINPSAFIRILGNIFSNAIKYSDGDFRIIMNEQGEITFQNHASNLNNVIVGRLFDRFYTVQTGNSSTGLGLSIAKTLTEQMGGTMVADYEEEQLRIVLNFSHEAFH